MNYNQFLESKIKVAKSVGINVDESQLNKHLFPFQKFLVKRALKHGKYALFEDCGLGKTIQQLEWAQQVLNHTGKPVLIVAPLAVVRQTIKEGLKFGYTVIKYLPEMITMHQTPPGIYITNYDQLHNINADDYAGIVLDESSILKNEDGAITNLVFEAFANTPYKLACTATPSPNDPMELGTHAEFLDVMTRNQMLAMYFVHDGGETSKWRIKGHAIKSFYRFVGTWAVMLSSPKNIGFDMAGYDLPSLNLYERQIKTTHKNNFALFNDTAVSATTFNQELRITKVERLTEAAKILNDSNELFIATVKQNEEADFLKGLVPDAIEVRGNDSPEFKEQTLLDFADSKFRVLLSKGKIIKFGLNYQNCHNILVCSLDFSFEELYQLIRRCYRFGQKHPVNLYLITTDTMSNVIQSINHKQKQFEIMQKEMEEAINADMNSDNEKNELQNQQCEITESYSIFRNDSIAEIKNVRDESWGLSVFSPPFPELYVYSSHREDLGNCKDYNQFKQQFNFLLVELYRVMKQGRNVCIHCMDTPIQKGKHGYIGLRDFSGDIISAMTAAGFIYHSRITIWKDPVVEMQRTKALGLLRKQVKKDSTMSRVGIPDYVLIFRKDGERSDPVANKDIPVDLWQKYASPVWMDIDQGDTLQGLSEARDEKDEKHICPLQLTTIERLIHLYSNVGDIVGTPFLGIGSEVYQAVKMGRKGWGCELKEKYFEVAKRNCKKAVESKNQLRIDITA